LALTFNTLDHQVRGHRYPRRPLNSWTSPFLNVWRSLTHVLCAVIAVLPSHLQFPSSTLPSAVWNLFLPLDARATRWRSRLSIRLNIVNRQGPVCPVDPSIEGSNDHIPLLPKHRLLYPSIYSIMAIITSSASTHSMPCHKKKHNAARNTVEPDSKRERERERELKPSISLDAKPETCQARRRGMAKVGKACDRCKLKKCKVRDIPSLNHKITLTGFAVRWSLSMSTLSQGQCHLQLDKATTGARQATLEGVSPPYVRSESAGIGH